MNRTTDEWEALLEGTTEGPWENSEYGLGPFWGDFDGRPSGVSEDEELMVLAPESVAEVVRLRRELEELRDEMDRKVRLSSAFGTSGYAEVSFRSSLTRILNGDPQ